MQISERLKKTSLTRIGSTHPKNFTRICVPYVGQHTPPQLSPSEEGHGNFTPDASTRLQGKRNCVGIIIGLMRNRTFQALHHTVKRSAWQPTQKKQPIPPTTSQNKLLNNNSHETPTGKKTQHRNPLVFDKFGQPLFFQSFYNLLHNFHHEQTWLINHTIHHPRMFGHENSPCEWVTSHLSEDMGHVVLWMCVFGDPWTNNNELKSYGETQKVTQLSRTQLHTDFGEIMK